MSKELAVLSPDEIIESGVSGINEKDLPVMIQGQIRKLNELDESVAKALKAADLATDSANNAKNKSAGFGKKKVAIEELQSAGIDLAEAVQSGAEAQKISFEFQTKLAEITKYLFGLGVSNIASNRFVVRELEMKLKGASQEELSDLARQEIMTVVKQLKDQEDILKKQENITQTIKIHDERLKDQYEKSQQMDEQLQAQAKVDKLHSEQLKLHSDNNKRLEEQLKAQAEIDRLHSEQLHAQAVSDKLHDEQLKIQAETDKKLEEKLQAQEEIDKLHDKQLKIQAETDKKLEEKLQAQAEVDKLHDEQLKIQAETDIRLEEKLQAQEEIDKLHEEQLKIQAETDKRLEDKLQAQTEVDQLHDKQLKIHSENVKKHEEQLVALLEKNNDLTVQINSNLKTIEAQEIIINMLRDEMTNLKILLDTKANNTLSKCTLAIAIIALVVSVIHFFL